MTSVTRVPRWQTGLVVALVTGVLAVAFGVPSLLFLAVVALGFVLVGYASGDPEHEFTLERSLSEDRPRPGQSVTVSLSMTNDGDRVAPDVRVVDAPPEEVAVVGERSGPESAPAPALATALRPGETVTLEYDLVPPRGEFTFGTPTVHSRNAASVARHTDGCEPTGTDSFACETLLDSFPAREKAIQFVGRTPTDHGGSGVEFYATREYRHGDPINRIDWNRYARTGDLTTVEYREERAVTVVFVIDDRAGVRRRPPGGGPDSLDLSLYAASRGVLASLEDGNRTGFTTLAADVWVDPTGDSSVRQCVEEATREVGTRRTTAPGEIGVAAATGTPGAKSENSTLWGDSSGSDSHADVDFGSDSDSDSGSDSDSDFGSDSDPDTGFGQRTTAGSDFARDLEQRLPTAAQVVLCSPVSDAVAVDLVHRLCALGRAVTVVSPDVTTGVSGARALSDEHEGATRGTRIARLERTNRLEACRDLGATVVDWDVGDPLSIDLTRAIRRGRRRVR